MPARLDSLIRVRSQKTEWVLAYLDAIAEKSAELPGYFPGHLKKLRSGGEPAFAMIRQQLQVIEDRQRFDQEQARLDEQYRLENNGPESPYSPNLKDVVSGEMEDRLKEKKPVTFTWDDRAIHRYPRLVILGDPGAGKSWLLKYEAHRLAVKQAQELRAQRIDLDELCLPVFVHLADLAKHCQKKDAKVEQALAAILKDGVGKALEPPADLHPFLVQKLKTGRCLLLLDAWDEMPEKQRAKCITALHTFYKDFKQPKALLTSRIVGYSGNPMPNAKEVELLGFDRKQQTALAKVWYGHDDQALADFKAATQVHSSVRYLMRIPLMLSLALNCRLYQNRSSQDKIRNFFPTRRVDLYTQCLWNLLTTWEQEKKPGIAVDPLEIEDWLDKLALAAFNLTNRQQELFTDQQFLAALESENTKGSRSFVEAMRKRGILVRLGSDNSPQLMFLHRTFQENLTARHLKNLIESSAKNPKTRKRQQEQGWRIVEEWSWTPYRDIILELLAGLLEDPAPLLDLLANAETDGYFRGRLVLAAQSLPELAIQKREVLTQRIERICEEVIAFVENASTPDDKGRFFNFPQAMNPALVALGKLSEMTCSQAAVNFLTFKRNFELLSKIGTKRVAEALLEILAKEELADSIEVTDAIKTLGQIGLDIAGPDLGNILLESSIDIVRDAAASALQLIGTSVAVFALINVLENSENGNKRGVAVRALGALGSRAAAAVPALLNRLNNDFSWIQLESLMAIINIDSASVLPPLCRALLEDADVEVRVRAATALAKIGSDSALPPLCRALLEDADVDVRVRAAISLAEIGSDSALPPLCRALLEDADVDVRVRAAISLAEIGSDSALPPLCRALLEDADVDVRVRAAISLAEIGSDSALPPLCRALLEDADVEVRANSAWALGEIGSDSALPPLCRALLEDADVEVRANSAWALGEIGSTAALCALNQSLLEENDGIVREKTVVALARIRLESASPYLCQVLSEDKNKDVRFAAAVMLTYIASESIVRDFCQALLKDADVKVRAYAATALAKIGSDSALPPLCRALLEDADVEVRVRAAISLAEIGSDSALPPLCRALLEDADVEVRANSAWALGEIGSDSALPTLNQALLKDEEVRVRYYIVSAMLYIDAESSVPFLFHSLSNYQSEIHGSFLVPHLVKCKSRSAILKICRGIVSFGLKDEVYSLSSILETETARRFKL
jgi:HEAT repeat protein